MYPTAESIPSLTMVNIQRSWLSSSLLALSLFAPQALSVVFEAVDAPGAVRPLLGRGDQSNDAAALSIFDRLSKDSYYWSGMAFPWRVRSAQQDN